MRTGVELPPIGIELDELELRVRHVGANLVDALKELPPPEQIPTIDRERVQDIRRNIVEALRLTVEYRRRLTDRLACATPGQSHSTSTHDPPAHAPERSSPT